MEILADGRFVVLGNRFSTPLGLFFIDPVADTSSGLAELTAIPINISSAIQGKLNGLTSGAIPDCKAQEDIAVTSVPTLGGTGLVILSLSLFLLGYFLMGRRAKTRNEGV